jgi:hypothetical protein
MPAMTSAAPRDVPPHELLFPDAPDELALTRRILALVPDGRSDWTPHPKSMPLGRLATHVAELPNFVTIIFTLPELDFATSGWSPAMLESTSENLALFDKRAAEMTAALAATGWPTLGESWVVRAGGQVFFNDTRAKLVRNQIAHLTHHRAQLGVYLRLLDIAIPGSYGPSADES